MPETPERHWAYTIKEWGAPKYQEMLTLLPSEVGVIYDIGANVGGFSHVIQQKYPKAAIHAFEPVKINYDALVKYMPNINHHKLGIYYGFTKSVVQSRGDSNIGAFFVEHIDAGEPRINHDETMDLVELESLQLPPPDLIKLDVEGAEENILEHSDLCRKTPYILLEWHPNTEPVEFFKKHLPNHKILSTINTNQFLLAL
jgi:FkbM family methyltransferase